MFFGVILCIAQIDQTDASRLGESLQDQCFTYIYGEIRLTSSLLPSGNVCQEGINSTM